MFNVGGGEFLVILLIALIVLGPQKLPEAARQVGHFARELRKMSAGFQDELKHALDEPFEEEARERGRKVVSSEEAAAPAAAADAEDAASASANDADSSADDAPTARDDDPDPATAGDPIDRSNATDVDPPRAEAGDPGSADVRPVEPERPISTAEAAGMYDLMPKDGAADDEAPS